MTTTPANPAWPPLIPAGARLPDFGRRLVAGVDEAGRGALAGPVVAAAVILNPQLPVEGCADSKTLSAEQRQTLAAAIKRDALAWAVASADVGEIYELNILNATMLAMSRALRGLKVAPQLALIDGNRRPETAVACCAVIGGDARVGCISAASILAKTERDRQMVRLHSSWPAWNFAAHKGYGTPEHLRALQTHGACDIHRKRYRGVRETLAQEHPQQRPQQRAQDRRQQCAQQRPRQHTQKHRQQRLQESRQQQPQEPRRQPAQQRLLK